MTYDPNYPAHGGADQPGGYGMPGGYGQTGGYGTQGGYGQPGGYGTPAVHREVSIGAAFSHAWQTFSNNVGPWVVFGILTLVLNGAAQLPSILSGGFTYSFNIGNTTTTNAADAAAATGNLGLSLLSSALALVVGLLLGNWATQAALRAADGEKLEVGDMFKLRNFGPYALLYIVFVVGSIVLAIIILIGWVALLVCAVLFYFAPYATVDRGVGIMESLKESAAIAKNNLGTCIGLGVIFALLTFASFLTLGLALIVVAPLSYLAAAYVYRAGKANLPQAQLSDTPYPQQY